MDLPKLPRSKKRRDELVEKARTRVEVLEALLEEAQDARSSLLTAMVLEASSSVVEDPTDIEIGGWQCPESPVGTCAYNLLTDPSQDFCLFCGNPSERK